MKKLLALILALSIVFSLCACGKSANVKNAEKLISAIGEVTADSGRSVSEARSAFASLSEEEKEQVQNYSELKDAEAKYKELSHIKKVSDLIDAIGTVSLDSIDALDEARAFYDSLTDKEKAQVPNYSALVDAENAYARLCKEAVDDAERKIADYDMEEAYKLLKSLSPAYSDDVERLTDKIDRLCYDNTFLVRAENIFSVAPTTTEVTDQGAYRIYAYNFSSAAAVETVMSEYYKYLCQHYSTDDKSSTSYSAVSAQSYEFKTDTGHIIKLTSMNAIIYFVNISIELDADYRDSLG